MLDQAVTESPPTEHASSERLFVWPPLLLTYVSLWLIPLGTSMGLDEGGNYWVISDGLRESFARMNLWAGTSWISNGLFIAARSIGGDHEFVLRLPSILAATLTLAFLYAIGKRLVGELAAAYACLILVSLREVVHIASVIRPYAVALLFTTAAMWLLLRWLDTGRARFGLAYTLCVAAIPHAHILYATTLPVHAIYAWQRQSKATSRVNWAWLAVAWGCAAVLAIPILQNHLVLSGRTNMSSLYLGPPDTTEFLASIGPPLLLGSMVFGVVVCFTLGRSPMLDYRFPKIESVLLSAWLVVPPVTLFLVSTFTDLRIFTGRYYLGAAPALALFAGAFIAGFREARVQRTVLGAIAVCAVLVLGVHERFYRGLHDWRGAAEATRNYVQNRPIPVLAISGFVESSELAGLQDPRYSEVLFEPLVHYGVGSSLIGLPVVMSPEVEPFMNQVIQQVSREPEFVLVGIDSFSSREYRSWIKGKTSDTFHSRSLGNFAGIELTLFQRAR